MDINSLDIDLENEDNNYIYEQLIKVLNKYNFIDNLEDIKDILIEEFKKIKNKKRVFINEINIIDVDNNIIEDTDYIFYMNFNQGYAPNIIKDEDFISNKDRIILGLDTNDELNNINKNILKNTLNSIKNLYISYKLKSSSGSFEASFLIDELNYKVIKDYKIENIYSHKMNRIKLSSMLDELIKYQNLNDDVKVLFNNYQDIPYLAYDNSFKGILESDFYKYINNSFNLSYSSMDNYYKCGFRFYLNNILKIDKNEDLFVAKIGSIFHGVLEKAFSDNFNFDDCFEEIASQYELSTKESIFISKLKEDLIFIIDTIKKQNTYSSLDKALYEEKVYVNKDRNIKLTFKGIIDKLMYKEIDGANYVVIVDYKTGNPDINLNNVYYGLNMQLPIYIYLAKHLKKIKNVKIVGFYLQKILHSKPKKDSKKDLLKLRENELKLEGFTNNNLEYISLLDSNYADSNVVKGFKLNKSGLIDGKTRALSDKQIDNLVTLTEKKIDEAFTKILERDFAINPKQIDNNNVGCEYCKYKDICFKKGDNIVYLDKKDYKTFLEEGE